LSDWRLPLSIGDWHGRLTIGMVDWRFQIVPILPVVDVEVAAFFAFNNEASDRIPA
jgi:hypothetical protein